MRPLVALRWTGAYWFLPALFAITCLVGASDTILIGYPTADIASTSGGLYLAAPLVAAYVAARFHRFPRLLEPLRSARSGGLVVVAAWWPLLVGSAIVVCLAVTVTARSLPNDRGSWSLVLVDFTTVLAAASIGILSTWAVPVVVAVPSVCIGLFFWLSYVPSTTVPLLHNLDATFPACCDSATRPATVAVTASVALAALICLGVTALLARNGWARTSRPGVAIAAVLILSTSFAAAAALAEGSSAQLTLQAVETRTGPLECRSFDGLRTCLWPENRGRAGRLASIANGLNPRLARWGLPQIDGLTQADQDPSSITVQAGAQLTEAALSYTIAAGYVDHLVGCLGAVGRARDERVGLLSLAAGLTEDSLAGRFEPGVLTSAADRFARAEIDPEAVRSWFRDGLGAVSCPRAR